MSDKIKKFLSKLSQKQLIYLLPYIAAVAANEINEMNCKPLKGNSGIYRIRAGRYRIIFRSVDASHNDILFVGKRDDKTYRDF